MIGTDCYVEEKRRQADRHTMMTQEPVRKLILKLAVPTIISMSVTAMYNLVDSYFIGHLSTNATAGVGIAFAYQSFIQAIGFFFGSGSGNYISRALGARKEADAEYMASTGFFSSFIVGTVITLFGLIFIHPFAKLLGATPEIEGYATDYLRYLLIAAPIMISQMVLNNQLRLQGNASQAMIGLVSGAIINIILDPIFIYHLNLGVSGASLATMISQTISWCILFTITTFKGNVHIRIKRFKPTAYYYKNIFGGGIPSFLRQSLGCIATILLNWGAAEFAVPGEESSTIAAFAVVSRIMLFAMSIILGFGQGFQPVCGYNWGAELYKRVKESYLFTMKTSTIIICSMSAAGIIFAPEIVAFFRDEDPILIEIGARVLRWQCLAFPLVGLTTPTNMLLQNICRTLPATILAMSRQGLFFSPAILIVPQIWGIRGLEATMAIADTCTFLLALPFVIGILNELSAKEKVSNKQ